MFRSKAARADRAVREAARVAAEPKYEIIEVDTGQVLQEVSGTDAARNEHETWRGLWQESGGPRTILRMKPTGVPAARDTLDALILKVVPGNRQKAYRRALELIITGRVPAEELLWLADGGRR